ncbi:MAG: GNAT family N-acetyltransferase [Syntrophomonadaceae bacterium]|nr:GNAT family N-acetyltransferase [Syntrophomonadaceae bacterium]
MSIATGALLPLTTHLEEITQLLRQTLNTPIAMTPVRKKEELDFLTRAYWWRTDTTNPVVRGQQAFKFVQLQIEFDSGRQVVIIDFLCIPEEQKGQGKGKIIVNKIIEMARVLGYVSINIEAQETSVPFWQRVGFMALEPTSTRFPKAMFYSVKPPKINAFA